MKISARFAVLVLSGLLPALLPAQTSDPANKPEMQAPVSDHGSAAPSKALASPAATTDTILNGNSIIVKYNSPAMRGRTIMGGVVPYGKVWRTGANPATSFVTAGNIMVGDLRVPAGSYTLYTLPAAPGTPWQLIINKQIGQWGTIYKPEQDLGRTPMQTATLPSPQESMTITLEKAADNSVQLHIKWDTTNEFVTITPAS